MKKSLLILSFFAVHTFIMMGQNYMGKTQSEILKSIGTPDSIDNNCLMYNSLDERGVDLYHFDGSGKCNSFEIIRNNYHLDEYQRILTREFDEVCQNKYVKTTRKINYIAEMVLSKDSFKIIIQYNQGTPCKSVMALSGN